MRTNLAAAVAAALSIAVVAPARAGDWSTDLDASYARAAKEKKPLVVEVWQEGCAVCSQMAKGPLVSEGFKKRLDGIVAVRLEAEKDRAKAARYQPNGLPTIIYLSPRGVILDRTEKFVSEDDLAKKIDALAEASRAADEELEKLEAARKKDAEDILALEKLASFWLSHQNWAEAIPHLTDLVKMAGEKEYSPQNRAARWVDLIRGLAIVNDFDESVKQAENLSKYASSIRKTDLIQMAEFLIGYAREHQGKKDDAVKAYDRAIELGPTTRVGKKAAELRAALKGK